MKSALIAITLCMASLAAAQGENQDYPEFTRMTTRPILKLKGKEAEAVDQAQYRPASREYRIGRGPAIVTYKEADVDYCIAPKPANFDTIKEIEPLEEIVKTYDHLWWDLQSAGRLMELYNQSGSFSKATALYRSIESRLSSCASGCKIKRAYWKALLGAKQHSVLNEDLKAAAAGPDRPTSAWAYVARGEMLNDQGKLQEALADGYLKTVAMFTDIADARKEALTEAIALMEKAGDRRVGRFQKMLKAEFGTNRTAAE